VGRASNRKKAQRQTGGPNLRRINQEARSLAVARRSAFGLDAMVHLAGERVRRRSTALRAWFGDTEPAPAEVPPWPEGSLGHRLLAGTPLGEARDAPSLLTAKLPDPATITADPRHWTIATEALIRAVVFDGLSLDHPAVSALLQALVPVVEDEVAHMRDMDEPMYSIGPFDNDDEIGFPALDGPVFLLGRALVEAVWATVGDDSLAGVDSVLEPALDAVAPGLDAPLLVNALIAASYTREGPPGTQPLHQLMNLSDNPLEILVLGGKVLPSDVLPVGLLVLSALARLCQSSSDSVLRRTPVART
jgi:hypothetical protein